MILLNIFLPLFLYASEAPFQKMIEGNQSRKTQESEVIIDGIRYKKIEIDTDVFYISAKGRTSGRPQVYCARPDGYQSEKLLDGGIKLIKRKVAYISALKESCSTKNGQVRSTVEHKPELGIFLSNDKSSAIKNKKLGINPLDPSSVNFSGEF